MLFNHTPHPVNLYLEDTPDGASRAELERGLLVSIPPSGRAVRLATTDHGLAGVVQVQGVPVGVVDVRYGGLEGAPEPEEGALHVVSLVTALAARRRDFVVPHDLVRNADGTVIGCRRLGRVC